jgi:SAM-dependent methyltransferase
MVTAKDSQNNYSPAPQRAASRLASIATQCAVRRQRRFWSRRANSWDVHGAPALRNVTAAAVAAAAVQPGDMVIDLGSGTGQVSLPLALEGAEVLAVDVSPAMADLLQSEAARRNLYCLHTVATPVEELRLPAGCADVIVSSYALHHLRDADKRRLASSALGWLRPGGRLVVADMMFGRGGSSRDREIIKTKVIALARRGTAGWWRIAKNAVRYLLRVQECPISMAAWTDLLGHAGFTNVTASAIVAEAGLVTAERPGGRKAQSAHLSMAAEADVARAKV